MERRWLKTGAGIAVGVVTIISLFVLLQTNFGFIITDLTGNFSCEGTYENPCISEFVVKNPTKYNVDIYSKDQVKLDFSPGIKDYALFVPDGRCTATGKCACEMKNGEKLGFKGLRCVDFTNKTKPRQDKVYNFRFQRYSTTEFTLAGIKNNPKDEIKWTFGTNDVELDPVWLPQQASMIDEFISTWEFEIIEDTKQEVSMEVIAINETLIELTLTEHPNSTTSNGYKWNMALCNDANSGLKYLNEDAQGGFDNAIPLNPIYGKLTDFGMNETWCNGGNGSILFSSGSKNEFPKKIRLITGNMIEFTLYAGTGSVLIDGAINTNFALDVAGENMCMDEVGVLHISYISEINDLWYGNSTDNGTTWSIKELDNGPADYAGIVCGLNNNLTAFFRNDDTDDNIDIYESSDGGALWTSIKTGFNTTNNMAIPSCVVDSGDVVHCVARDVTNSTLWYVNSSTWDEEVLLGQQSGSDDTDHGDIEVDVDDNIYIIGTGSDEDDVDIWSSIDGYATRNQIDGSLGSVSGVFVDAGFAIDIDLDGNIYYAGPHTNDLQFCNGTTTNWDGGSGAWDCKELSTLQSRSNDIAVSLSNEIHILHDSNSASSSTILRSNSSNNGTTFESRTELQAALTFRASIADSMFPTSNRLDSVLRYIFTNATGVYYDSYEITTFGEAPADSCTYTSGDWNIDATDNCVISDNVIIDGSNVLCTGSGTFTIQDTFTVSNFGRRQFSKGCYYQSFGSGGFFQ